MIIYCHSFIIVVLPFLVLAILLLLGITKNKKEIRKSEEKIKRYYIVQEKEASKFDEIYKEINNTLKRRHKNETINFIKRVSWKW